MKQNSPQFQAYAALARYLFDCIEPLDQEDSEALQAYSDITWSLNSAYYDEEPLIHKEGHLLDGYMLELHEWIGLKTDSPEMAQSFGKDIKQGYPEVFAGPFA